MSDSESAGFKLFGRNTAIYAIGNMALRGVAFLLLPLYTHGLSMTDYGRLAAILLTIEFLWMIMGAGMLDAVVRFSAASPDDRNAGALIGSANALNFAAGALTGFLCYLYLQPLFRAIWHVPDSSVYVILASTVALAQSLFLQNLAHLRVRNQAARFVTFSVIAATLILILTIVFVNGFHLGILGVLLAQSLSYLVVTTAVLLSLTIKHRPGISLTLARELLQFGFPLVFAMLGRRAIGGVAIYMLMLLATMQNVAVYSVGSRIAQILAIVLILPFQLAFQPMLFSNLDKANLKALLSRILTYLTLATAALSFLILVSSRFLLPLIAPATYTGATLVIALSLPAIGLQGIGYFAEGLLNVEHQSKRIGAAYIAGTVGSLVLGYFLIPRFGLIGALIATNISYAVVSFALLFSGFRILPFPIEWRRMAISVGLFTILIPAVSLIWPLRDPAFYAVCFVSAMAAFVTLKLTTFFDKEESQAIRSIVSAAATKLAGLFTKPSLKRS